MYRSHDDTRVKFTTPLAEPITYNELKLYLTFHSHGVGWRLPTLNELAMHKTMFQLPGFYWAAEDVNGMFHYASDMKFNVVLITELVLY
jgi:hypothetical protein